MAEDLRARVLRYRAIHGLSQEALARMCGVTKATIWNLEAGKSNPTKLTEEKINIVIEREG